LEAALALDKLYIPTRCPDALAELTPGEAYTPSQARAAIAHARAILQAVASRLG
jgi:HEPN domain-containing protein